ILFFISIPYILGSQINKKVIIIILLAIITSLIGISSNIINNIDINKVFTWISFLVAIYFFYKALSFFNHDEFIKGMLLSGLFFSFTVLLVHFLLITNLIISPDELLFLLNFVEGFFHRYSILGFDYYSIYFQSTLTLTVFTFIAYLNKYYKIYLLFIFILAISLSRFGVFVSLLLPLLIYFFNIRIISKIIVTAFIPISIIIILFYSAIYYYYYDNFTIDVYYGLSSSEARIAHIISTFQSFDLKNFFLGQGLGSEFFTIRSNSYVDNTELSQLEFLRKFGFFGYMTFHSLIFTTMYCNHTSKNYSFNIYIISIYFASMSNPILTSLIFAIFIGYSLKEITNKKGNYERQ
ncbi:hypothetical protein HOK00_01060, partial [bacterium]|nr:hypothetical protein [bacterium]